MPRLIHSSKLRAALSGSFNYAAAFSAHVIRDWLRLKNKCYVVHPKLGSCFHWKPSIKAYPHFAKRMSADDMAWLCERSQMVVSGCIILQASMERENAYRLERLFREHPAEAPQFWIHAASRARTAQGTELETAIHEIYTYGTVERPLYFDTSRIQEFARKNHRKPLSADQYSKALNLLARHSDEQVPPKSG